ncbi:UDP-3-O-(3-hydroxymyristoyl) N-acetylglucosamine deacetylase [Crinalium epipsammum PCC 9333]|uniref:UDP-3-O-acyl-N-acetylglucosamine deacetylase n=1 Tax=Crinalium epipsammum PCC 9333 TaxID=1173022 RepID=K9VX02_9CYAN|nr:UDP-3-O-acyl-N-acetylglucosamine deacetylase [Crinalium epipsammum]AFZ12074.1 UDP-3-O-(3-hydroxymyristoyl) N-acetylglucosamine deacetylase [Crinalium epipsammum PCC 9333]
MELNVELPQQTLAREFEMSGVGLHGGVLTAVRVKPAYVGEGRYFVRVDLPNSPHIPARVDAVNQTTLSTELAAEDARVRTVEHLLAALAGMGVDNARIEINGAELPLLDGSAKLWAEAIATAGIVQATGEQNPTPNPSPRAERGVSEAVENNNNRPAMPLGGYLEIKEPIWVYQGDAFVAALPAPATRFTYGIDFDLPAIGNQWHSWTPSTESFESAIAPARTFGLAHQIDQLRASGLIKGGSLDNALVCDANGWLNPPLRFANEPARHKLLDLIGDLSLLGRFPQAHFLAYKASHSLHIQLAQKIQALNNDQ